MHIRLRLRGLFLGSALAVSALRADLAPTRIDPIGAPGRAGSGAPRLAAAPNGVWMAWAEPADEGVVRLACARLTEEGPWSEPKPIASGRDFAVHATTPFAFAAGADGRLAAIWPIEGGGHQADFAVSTDAGAHWTSPVGLTKESQAATHPAVCIVQMGLPLAIWLDQRAPGPASRLYLRFLTGPLTAAPDYLLASNAMPGCAPAIRPLLDGNAIVSYRVRQADGTTVPGMIRLHARRWQAQRPITPKAWTPAGTPPEGIPFEVDGGRIAATWIDAGNTPTVRKVLASASPDAGTRFLMPATVATGGALTHPAIALLHDGAALATWLDGGTVHLERLSPEFYNDPETPLESAGAAAPKADGAPQIAVLRDYQGAGDSAELVLAYRSPGEHGAIQTLRVTVPEGDLLAAAAEDCHCAPSPAALVGYAMRGTVTAIDLANGRVTMTIDAVPGVMDAGARRFVAETTQLLALKPGTDCLGRIERSGEDWKVFDLHVLDATR